MHSLGDLAITFLCLVGTVYSLFLLGDCYRQWKRRQRKTTAHTAPVSRRQHKDWWCQTVSALLLLTVAITLCLKKDRHTQNTSDQNKTQTAPVASVEVRGMLPVASSTILRDRDRPGAPVVAVNMNSLPVTDADIRALQQQEPGVMVLVLTDTKITNEAAQYLRRLPHLKDLGLRRTEIGDSACKELSHIANLEIIDLSDTAITDEALKYLSQLTKLRSLYLRNTAITDAGLKSLHTLEHLEYLDVCKTRVTTQGIKKLKQALPNLACYGGPPDEQ